MSWRTCVRARRVAAVRRAARPARPAARPSADQHGLGDERPGHAGGEQRRADRRAGELVDGDEARPCSRALAMARSSRVAPASAAACWTVLSANDLGGAEQEQRDQHHARSSTVSVTIDGDEQRPARTARSRSTATTITPAVEPVGERRRRTARTAAAAATAASAASATRNGSSVCDATSSGPAASAMPSPRLLVHDDASSHRKPGPRRAGAMDFDDPGHRGLLTSIRA